MGIDIGGTHITAGVVDMNEHKLIEHSIIRIDTNSGDSVSSVLESWATAIRESSATINDSISGIGIAMPGPFDYENGISEIRGLGKYDALFGCNIRYALASRLKDISPQRIRFMNDAHCFLVGESWYREENNQRLIGLTFGTGFGAAFWKNDRIVVDGDGVPEGGFLFNQPFRNSTAEDYFNGRWFIQRYNE